MTPEDKANEIQNKAKAKQDKVEKKREREFEKKQTQSYLQFKRTVQNLPEEAFQKSYQRMVKVLRPKPGLTCRGLPLGTWKDLDVWTKAERQKRDRDPNIGRVSHMAFRAKFGFAEYKRHRYVLTPGTPNDIDFISPICVTENCGNPDHILSEPKTVYETRSHCLYCIRNIMNNQSHADWKESVSSFVEQSCLHQPRCGVVQFEE